MNSTEQFKANRNDYVGLFLLVMSTIAFEILLTRIFSVTMWYHFAFMAISIAMFGMTIGAMIVYFKPKLFINQNIRQWLLACALCLAITIVTSFVVHSSMPFFTTQQTDVIIRTLTITYLVVAVPFVFSGIAVCLALTKFPAQLGKLYATDLTGASFGCLIIIPLLGIVDGPTAILVVATLAAAAAFFFARGQQSKKLELLSLSVLGILFIASIGNWVLAKNQEQFFRINWTQNSQGSIPAYEKWNCFSRITVEGDPNEMHRPFAWGLSSTWPEDKKVSELILSIDGLAWTMLTGFDGDWRTIDYLKYDVTNLAHKLRSNARVLVVGVGGGRDILSALAFKQKSVEGVEINNDILNTLTKVYGPYTGHLDCYPQVKLINDEARSYIASSKEKFDIIEISLVDTFAASAAGAFILSENSLYTVQAWKTFLNHLSPRGVLSVTRWYVGDNPSELYRLESLTVESLLKLGIRNPRQHIIIVAQMGASNGGRCGAGVATLLVSKEPFSKEDIDAAVKFAHTQKFGILLSPETALKPMFADLANPELREKLLLDYPANISPTTDDNPFFFYFLKPTDVFKGAIWMTKGTFYDSAVRILSYLTIIVLTLTFLCILVPLLLQARQNSLKEAGPLLLYFSCIGLGFMFIEISQMQRLILFLGHPTYGLSVVLFTLLLGSGIGSFFTSVRRNANQKMYFCALLILLCLFGALTPTIITALGAGSLQVRIVASIAIMLPLGFFMGMCFPIGMQIANERASNLTPWLWGVNGATSVCASVLAMVIAINAGIAASFWSGAICYLLAFAAFLWLNRQTEQSGTAHSGS